MTRHTPLYNSRITRSYVDYLAQHEPEYDVDSALERAGIHRFEVEDPTHWLTQEQVDRFHDILARETRNPHISREVGRYAAQAPGMGPAKRYTLGMLNPASVYLLAGRIAAMFSRGARVKARKVGKARMEITARANPGVEEKPYQCENRLGQLEAVSLLFSDRLADVAHPECMHRGGEACRYLVKIPPAPQVPWKRARNAAALLLIPACLAAALSLPSAAWIPLNLAFVLLVALTALQAERVEKSELARILRSQGKVARGELNEMETRASNALLIQEIGHAASSIPDENRLARTVLGILEQRLDFDRSLVFLRPTEGGPLAYACGTGQSDEQEAILGKTTIDVFPDRDSSGDDTRLADSTPRLLSSPARIRRALPEALADLLAELDIPKCICTPLICENELLGLLIVHRSHPHRALTKSDLSLLEGVASHMAVSMANARGYRKLEISEQNYRELVQSSNSVILRADPQGCITFLNRFAGQLFGLSEEEVLGRNLVGTILPDVPLMTEEIRNLFEDLRRNPTHRIAKETRSLRQNGKEIWIAWTFRALFDRGGDLKEVLCIGNDITEMTQTREEKEELKNRLHRARRMEAVGTLAGGVAHELNNILSGIVSYPELLLMDLSPESPLRRPVETIQKAGSKAAEIVQDMLLLSRRGVTTTEPLGLNHLVRMTLDSADHKELTSRHPGVRVALALEQDLTLTPASPEHLVRALRSLILNGFLAMPEGGTLRISTLNRTLDQDLEGYERVKAGSYAVLQVSDEGQSLGPEDLERIFEPFYTKKTLKRAGTGLGLPVVWGIVKDHGGFVDVSSGPDLGTTFTLYLPTVREDARPSASPRPEGDPQPGKGETVLVVDDIAEQRTIAAGILNRLGYRAVSMESGEAAVAYLAENTADLVVLDMVMDPGMDGLETYGRILDVRPGQRAIIASGYAETDRVREARRLGAGTYLKKPYTIEKLGRAVRRELDR